MVGFVLSLSRADKRIVLLLLDVLLVPVAFLITMGIHYNTLAPMGPVLANWPLIPLLMIASLALSLALGIPDIQLKNFDRSAVMRMALYATLLAISGFALAALGKLAVLPGFHIIFALVSFAVSSGARVVLLQILLAIYKRSAAVTRVLIYGAGRTGMALAAELRGRPDVVPVGFLDDNATLRNLTVAGLPVFAGIEIERIRSRFRVDRVILAIPSLSVRKQSFMSRRLEKLGLEVQTLPAFAQLFGGQDLLDRLQPMHAGKFLSREPMSDAGAEALHTYEGAVVLVTGAGGSIGLELCRQIVATKPTSIILYELSELALYNAEMELRVLAEDLNIRIVPILGSVCDRAHVSRVMRTNAVDVVLHAAAYKHVPLVEENVQAGLVNNVFGTYAVAQCARDCGVGRFVLISTDKAVYPASVMGATKRVAEHIVQDLATRSPHTIYSIVRFGNVLDSSGSVIPLFHDQIARGGPVTLTDCDVTRYFMTIHEAARLVLMAGSFAKGGEVFVLDMGEPVSIRLLAERLIASVGYTLRSEENPDGDIEIVTTGLRPGEKLHEDLMISNDVQLTAHPKIKSVREDHLSELEVAAMLRDLQDALDTENEDTQRKVLWSRVGAFDEGQDERTIGVKT